jgi:hypothetical protein
LEDILGEDFAENIKEIDDQWLDDLDSDWDDNDADDDWSDEDDEYNYFDEHDDDWDIDLTDDEV